MEADSGKTYPSRALLDVVVQNLRGIGATSISEFLGVQSLLHAGPPGGQDRPELSQPSPDITLANTSSRGSSVDVKVHGTVSAVTSVPASAPPPTATSEPASSVTEMDEYTREIEECCMEWRAGRVKPYWLVINEPKFGRTQGCALRVQISLRSAQVYSVQTTYPSPGEAKAACARAAIQEGILDFIRYGDGQTSPAVKLGPDDGESFNGEPIPPALESVQSWSVQAFYEALPRPFPESVGDKSASDINSPAWLNTTIQAARGSRLVSNFIWTADMRTGLHGALLRLERPEESKSWIVAARFSKRAEAKAAVCLQAMSDGVGEYIRAIIKEVDERLPPAVRKTINDVLVPMLLMEHRKIPKASAPQFDYQSDADACGCTMTLELAQNPTPEQVKKYSIQPEYRNRADAKMAVVLLAFQQGVIEAIRFKGRQPPPGYTPFSLQQYPGFGGNANNNSAGQYRKRKLEDNWGNGHTNSNGYGQGPNKKMRQNGGYTGQQQHMNAPRPFGRPGSGPGPMLPPHPPPPGAWTNPQGPPAPAYPMYAPQHPPPPQPYVPPPAMRPYVPPGAEGYSPLTPQIAPMHAQYPPQQPAPPPAQMYTYGAPMQQQQQQQIAPPPPMQGPYGQPPPPLVHGGYAYPTAPPQPAPQQQQQPQPQPQVYTPHIVGAPVTYATAPPYPQQPPPPPAPYGAPPAMQPWGPPSAPTPMPPMPTYPMQPGPSHAAPPPPPQPMQRNQQQQRERRGLPRRPGANGNGNGNGNARAEGGAKKVQVQAVPKTSVTQLYDYCREKGMRTPEFSQEVVKDPQGNSAHRVWVVIGKQKYEISGAQFVSLGQGQERVAMRVLDQLRAVA